MNREYLEKLARLAILSGVNLQKGQTLMIQADVEMSELTEACAKEAWKAGAEDVIVWYEDIKAQRDMFEHASMEVLQTAPAGYVAAMEDVAKKGGAFLRIDGEDPDAFAGIDPKRLDARRIAKRKACPIYREGIDSGRLAWSIIACPTKAWAKRVYPDLEEDQAMEKLWEDVFSISRIDENDPLENWKEHSQNLKNEIARLHDKKIVRFHYTSANGTDLWVDMPEGYLFEGGSSTLSNGTPINCNIPTEEIFSAPKKDGVNGTLEAVLPLSVNGTLVENFGFTFKDGKAVDLHAEKGEETLRSILDTDESSRYLGEIALVDKRSPIRQSGKIFYNTLFDENAACHFAFGQSYAETMENGLEMTRDELEAAGMNQSDIHVDFMVGAEDLKIEGITEDGEVVPVFENGSFTAEFDQ